MPNRPLDLVASLGVAPEDLVGMAEIAQLLGVAKVTAKRYAARPDFPEPLGTIAAGRVWRRAAVEAWGKAHLPLPRPGRPRKRER